MLDEKRLEDMERALVLAYSALLYNDTELAKQILKEQIEQSYETYKEY
jgi:uncharacterized protein with PhoU and TrkA domain